MTGFYVFECINGKPGKTERKEKALKRKILHHEPLEERQLLAADVLGGALPDVSELVGDSRLVGTTSLNAALTTNTALTTDFTTTLAIYPQWQDNVAINHWRATVREIDPKIPIVKFQLYNQQRVISYPELAARFGLDGSSPEDCIHSINEKYFPLAHEHGKIVPLVFGDPSELDNENGSDPGGVMKIMSGGDSGGVSGGTSGGQSGGQSGGNSGGCDGLVPYRSGGSGGNGIDMNWDSMFLISADSTETEILDMTAGYFINRCYCSMSYGYDFTGTNIATITQSTDTLKIVPNGTVGTGTITVYATNLHGRSDDTWVITLTSYRVEGFTIEERCIGQGIDDAGWHPVEDRDKSGGTWALLWQENEYRWRPIFASATEPVAEQVVSMVAFGGWGSGPKTVYSSGGWSGSMIAPGGGNGNSNNSGGGSSGTFSSNAWPCVYNTPTTLGEIINPLVSVRIEPPTGNYFYTNGGVDVKMKNTVPSAKQPKVAVTAIQSVVWDQGQDCWIRFEDDPLNGGKRCFPEENVYGTLNNTLYAKVTLAQQIPVGMEGTVYIAWFDPDNPIGSTITPSSYGANTVRDNHGSITLNKTKLTFNTQQGTLVQSALATFPSAHAGDNYIIAAHPNAGIPNTFRFTAGGKILRYQNSDGTWTTLDANHQTKVLTVWRTLWAELDQLTMGGSVFAGVPLIDGFVKTQLESACIDIKPYSPNPRPTTPGPLELPTTWDTWFTWYSPHSCADACRDIPPPSNTFWTVHMIGAFKNANNYSGIHYSPVTTIYIFHWKIMDEAAAWNSANPNDTISYDDCKRRVSLHEIGHAFGLDDNTAYGGGIMDWCSTMKECLEKTEFSDAEIWIIQAQPMTW